MSPSERYRTLADQAARAARDAAGLDERVAWRDIAESWNRLAREAAAEEAAGAAPPAPPTRG